MSVTVTVALEATGMTASLISELIRKSGADAVATYFDGQAITLAALESALEEHPVEAGCAVIAGLTAAVLIGPALTEAGCVAALAEGIASVGFSGGIAAGLAAVTTDVLLQLGGASLYSALLGLTQGLMEGLSDLLEGNPFPSDLEKSLGSWASALASLFGRVMTDPVVLDLSGNGVVLTSLSSSSAYFDLHGTGYAVKTGWVGASTGILVNSATPTSINDLFGNSSVDGFTALKALDTNSDGVINASDTGFSSLYVWVDANGDGTAGAGEVYTLSQLNITQINLSTSVVNTTVNGNMIGEVATFVYANGTTGQVAEAYFDNSTMDAEYTGSYTLNPEVLLLPNARGYGTVPDLFIAMSQDATLLAMVKALTNESATSAITSDDAIKAIIYEWTGVETVDPTSRGDYINAQHLAALEAFTGQAFVSTWSGTSSNPQNAHQGSTLESAWDTLFEAIKERLLVQGALASTLSGVSYDYSRDSFTGTADLASLCAGLGDATLTDVANDNERGVATCIAA